MTQTMSPPKGVPVREYQSYVKGNGNSGVWKVIAAGGWAMILPLLLAWFTAFSQRGVSQKDMEEYVKEHSPYALDKSALNEHQIMQDTAIGELRGKQERVLDRLNNIEFQQKEDVKDISEIRANLKTVSDFLENLKGKK